MRFTNSKMSTQAPNSEHAGIRHSTEPRIASTLGRGGPFFLRLCTKIGLNMARMRGEPRFGLKLERSRLEVSLALSYKRAPEGTGAMGTGPMRGVRHK